VGVRVRLSPEEAAVVRTAAARAGLSVGAWVGDAAVARARRENRGQGERPEPASWRELVASLMVMRAEVVGAGIGYPGPGVNVGGGEDAADRLAPVGPLYPAPAPGELLAVRSNADGDSRRRLVERIDAVTGAALVAASTAGRRSLEGGRRRPSRSS
jgi:hypothetical protein